LPDGPAIIVSTGASPGFRGGGCCWWPGIIGWRPGGTFRFSYYLIRLFGARGRKSVIAFIYRGLIVLVISSCDRLIAGAGLLLPVFSGIPELPFVSQVLVIPAAGPVSFVFFPVNSPSEVFVVSPHPGNIAVVVIVAVIIPGEMGNIILMMHPGLINSGIDNDHKAPGQVEIPVHIREDR